MYNKFIKKRSTSTESTVQQVLKMTAKDQDTSLASYMGHSKLPVVFSKSRLVSNTTLTEGVMMPKGTMDKFKKNAASASTNVQAETIITSASSDVVLPSCKSTGIDFVVTKDPQDKRAASRPKSNNFSHAMEVAVTKPKGECNSLLTSMFLTAIVHGISGIILAASKLVGLSSKVSYTVSAHQLKDDLRDFVGTTGICFNVLITSAYCVNGFTFMLYVGLYSYNILKGLVLSSLKSKSDNNKNALQRGMLFLAVGTTIEIVAWIPPLVGVMVTESDSHARRNLFLIHYSLSVFLVSLVTVGIPRVLGLLVRRIKKIIDQNTASETVRSNVSTLQKFQVLIWLYYIGGSFLIFTMIFMMVFQAQDVYLSTTTPVYLAAQSLVGENQGKNGEASTTDNSNLVTAMAEPLWKLARDGNLKEIDRLTQSEEGKEKINSDVDGDGWTPLMHAAENSRMDVVDLLLERGAKLDIVDRYGNSALMKASRNGHKDVAGALVSKGAKVDSIDTIAWTALTYASMSGSKETVAILLDKGASLDFIDLKYPMGRSALMVASYYGKKDVVDMLIARGAMVDLKDREGKRAVDLAREKGRLDCVRLLEESQAKVVEGAKVEQGASNKGVVASEPGGGDSRTKPAAETKEEPVKAAKDSVKSEVDVVIDKNKDVVVDKNKATPAVEKVVDLPATSPEEVKAATTDGGAIERRAEADRVSNEKTVVDKVAAEKSLREKNVADEKQKAVLEQEAKVKMEADRPVKEREAKEVADKLVKEKEAREEQERLKAESVKIKAAEESLLSDPFQLWIHVFDFKSIADLVTSLDELQYVDLDDKIIAFTEVQKKRFARELVKLESVGWAITDELKTKYKAIVAFRSSTTGNSKLDAETLGKFKNPKVQDQLLPYLVEDGCINYEDIVELGSSLTSSALLGAWEEYFKTKSVGKSVPCPSTTTINIFKSAMGTPSPRKMKAIEDAKRLDRQFSPSNSSPPPAASTPPIVTTPATIVGGTAATQGLVTTTTSTAPTADPIIAPADTLIAPANTGGGALTGDGLDKISELLDKKMRDMMENKMKEMNDDLFAKLMKELKLKVDNK